MPKPFSVTDPLWQCLCPIWNTTIVPGASLRLRSSRHAASFLRPRHPFQRSLHLDTQALRPSARETPDASLSTDSLHVRLNTLARQGNVNGCQRVVTHLLQTRKEPLSTSLYNALILSNIDAASGGAWRVRELLQEMDEENYAIDSVTCHNILKVLAVHPDHLLRADVLNRMRQNWFELGRDGYHDVAAGWLREGCIELAMATLERLQQQAIHVEPWLLDLFVYSLCDAQQLEPAYVIMRARLESGEVNISRGVWHYFLDAASNDRHLPGTELAWSARVGMGHIQASTGVAENALATAALHGAPALATDVFAHLTKRGDMATHAHYQHLIDSYLAHRSPDVLKAISILSIMAVEKLQPTKWQTRSMFHHIRQSSSTTAQALETIRRLYKQGRLVPLAAVNLIIESYAYQGDLAAASLVYKQIPVLLSNGPPEKACADLETFSILLSSCQVSDVDHANSLFTDMLEIKVDPDGAVYNYMVRLNALAAEVAAAAAVSAGNTGTDSQQTCEEFLGRALAHRQAMAERSFEAHVKTLDALLTATSAVQSARILNSGRSEAACEAEVDNKPDQSLQPCASFAPYASEPEDQRMHVLQMHVG